MIKTLLQRLFTPPPQHHARKFGLDAERGQWCFCAPVHFEARLDFLSLRADLRHETTATETAKLLASLNAHFAADGLRFHAPEPGLWLLQTAQPHDWPSLPPERVRGGNIAEHLPKNAILTAKILNEIQMLLFAHSVNADREARDQWPINGLWLWR